MQLHLDCLTTLYVVFNGGVRVIRSSYTPLHLRVLFLFKVFFLFVPLKGHIVTLLFIFCYCDFCIINMIHLSRSSLHSFSYLFVCYAYKWYLEATVLRDQLLHIMLLCQDWSRRIRWWNLIFYLQQPTSYFGKIFFLHSNFEWLWPRLPWGTQNWIPTLAQALWCYIIIYE